MITPFVNSFYRRKAGTAPFGSHVVTTARAKAVQNLALQTLHSLQQMYLYTFTPFFLFAKHRSLQFYTGLDLSSWYLLGGEAWNFGVHTPYGLQS